jgi:hypothetical protein
MAYRSVEIYVEQGVEAPYSVPTRHGSYFVITLVSVEQVLLSYVLNLNLGGGQYILDRVVCR